MDDCNCLYLPSRNPSLKKIETQFINLSETFFIVFELSSFIFNCIERKFFPYFGKK